VNAVIDQLNRWEERDARDGEDEAHFEAYVRWRVAMRQLWMTPWPRR